MKYRPLQDRVMIERIEEEEVSPSGILLPASSSEKSIKGRIVAVGPGKMLESGNRATMSVKVDDIVLFNEGYGVKSKKIEGKDYLWLSENDILAVIES